MTVPGERRFTDRSAGRVSHLVLKLPHLPLEDVFVRSVDLELIRAPGVQKIIQRFEAIFRIGIGDRLSRLVRTDPAKG